MGFVVYLLGALATHVFIYVCIYVYIHSPKVEVFVE